MVAFQLSTVQYKQLIVIKHVIDNSNIQEQTYG